MPLIPPLKQLGLNVWSVLVLSSKVREGRLTEKTNETTFQKWTQHLWQSLCVLSADKHSYRKCFNWPWLASLRLWVAWTFLQGNLNDKTLQTTIFTQDHLTVLFWSVKKYSCVLISFYILDLLSFSFIHLASHHLCGRNDRLVWLKFSKTAFVLIDQSQSMLLLSILLHPIRVIHYTVLELCCCWYCVSSGFIEHSADIQPSISAPQGETLDDM